MNFNWVAAVLRIIAVRIFFITTTSYFDDYPMLEFEQLCSSSLETFEGMLDTLGWKYAVDGKKRRPFENKFKALGACINLESAHRLLIGVENTEERIVQISEEIEGILSLRRLTSPVALSLRGKFNYAYGFFRGRPLAPALRQLSLRAEQRGGSTSVQGRLAEALQELKFFLIHERPRILNLDRLQQSVVLFTDGSFENGIARCGAVLFDPVADTTQYWGHVVSRDTVVAWNSLGSMHAIAQAELLPVLISLHTWMTFIADRYLMVFVDNNSVLDALIRGNTSSLASLELLSCTCRQLINSGAVAWFSRVPSYSNIADGPSRGDFSSVEKVRQSKAVQPILPEGLACADDR